jgi:tetrapyrrole methylase family protein/MazG family protein
MSSPDAGHRFLELLSLVTRLRGEDGCPWDRAQTRASLRPNLVEETYELLDALDLGEPERIREELGDLLFQVVFHAEIARERGEFSMADLLESLVAKMTRRHPHVFGDRRVSTPAEALAQWEAVKEAERASDGRSLLAGIPRSLPALLQGQQVQQRAARVGFDWPDARSALEKVREELDEVTDALREGDPAASGREVGDLLFAVVNVARLAGIDPERALQSAVDRFGRRFESMEQAARAGGQALAALSSTELERLWAEAKAREEPS